MFTLSFGLAPQLVEIEFKQDSLGVGIRMVLGLVHVWFKVGFFVLVGFGICLDLFVIVFASVFLFVNRADSAHESK